VYVRNGIHPSALINLPIRTARHATMPDSPENRLVKPAQFVKGVGPDRAERLRRLGVETVEQLLFYLPRDYQDLTDLRPIAKLEASKLQTARGKVVDLDAKETHKGGTLAAALIDDGTARLRGVWFNQPTAIKRFKVGDTVLFSGKPTWRTGCWEMAHPQVQMTEDASLAEPFLPIYPLTEDLRIGELRRILKAAVTEYAGDVAEILPTTLRARHRFPEIAVALSHAHFPPDCESGEAARRRLVFEEFLLLQLALAFRHRDIRDDRQAPRLETTTEIDRRIRRLFPFQLTADQNKAVAEISTDLVSGKPMNRLLQGDVGSGKTAVAAYALLVAIAQKHQAALMAPTELLARQHWQTFDRYLKASRVRRLLLTSSLSAAERSKALDAIRAGEVDLVVGTQAIIQEDVQFASLGLVVIDEQHKFGVRQRARFRRKGLDPHYLVMSATPIPRTLTMTVFGDLDVSTLREQPPGRKPVRTYAVEPAEQAKSFEFVRRKLVEGRQAYVVCPLVEESAKITARSAEQMAAQFRSGEFARFHVGLVHGRMEDAAREAAMDAFRAGQTQVLVSTLVVEVGIDVPNATVMIVVDAQRFGLSQLHQLRGRIARGAYPGFCFLFAAPESLQAAARLRALVDSTDGFKIAEEDLRLRGPGEFLGTRQHGLPELRVGDLLRDAELIQLARDEARQIVASDPLLEQAEHRSLRDAMLRRFGNVLESASAG
jgi:ATP-dependent DNA helicase RecG